MEPAIGFPNSGAGVEGSKPLRSLNPPKKGTLSPSSFEFRLSGFRLFIGSRVFRF